LTNPDPLGLRLASPGDLDALSDENNLHNPIYLDGFIGGGWIIV
jgi:hypothetical protein